MIREKLRWLLIYLLVIKSQLVWSGMNDWLFCRLEELNVIDVQFLHGCKLPTIILVHQVGAWFTDMPTIPLLAELFRISAVFPPFRTEFVKFRFSIPFI